MSWLDNGLETEELRCMRSGLDIYGRYIGKNGALLGNEFIISANINKNELGGFYGKLINGKVLGIIVRGLSLAPDEDTMTEDVYGSFYVSTGYEVFAPDFGEKLFAGGDYTIRWRTPPNAKKFNISYSNDNKATWTRIASNVTNKYYKWNVPAQNGRKPNSFIKIEAYDESGNLLSTFYSRPFSIEIANVTYPNGDLLISGQTYTIKWQTRGLNVNVAKTTVQYSTDGQNWQNIRTVNGNPGQINWKVPSVSQPKIAKVRIIFRDSDGKVIAITENSSVFVIQPSQQ
ncbi:MAG: discoidin domain-containing protein [Candidatus Omnitrophica bacterium]|nr:discoidin domain-containing protein [Candidatus Omnitrophota bacterium]